MQAVRAVRAAVSKTGLSPCGIQRTLRAGLIAMKQGMTGLSAVQRENLIANDN